LEERSTLRERTSSTSDVPNERTSSTAPRRARTDERPTTSDERPTTIDDEQCACAPVAAAPPTALNLELLHRTKTLRRLGTRHRVDAERG
jgi:hypothetical protein